MYLYNHFGYFSRTLRLSFIASLKFKIGMAERIVCFNRYSPLYDSILEQSRILYNY